MTSTFRATASAVVALAVAIAPIPAFAAVTLVDPTPAAAKAIAAAMASRSGAARPVETLIPVLPSGVDQELQNVAGQLARHAKYHESISHRPRAQPEGHERHGQRSGERPRERRDAWTRTSC